MQSTEYRLQNAEANTHSPFRALLWKEWREQRMVALVLIALMLLMAALCRAESVFPLLSQAIGIMLPLAWALVAAILGANAFAGDREARTEPFAAELPVPPARRFWAKLLVALIPVSLYEGLGLLIAPNLGPVLKGANYVLLVFLLSTPVFALAAAVASRYTSSPLLLVLAAMIAGGAGSLLIAESGLCLAGAGPVFLSPGTSWVMAVATAATGVVTAAFLARWLWTTQRETWTKEAARLAASAALFLVALAAPFLGMLAFTTAFVPTVQSSYHFLTSKTGQISFMREQHRWPRTRRVWAVDPATGQRRLIFPWHPLSFAYPGPWSPDGRWLLAHRLRRAWAAEMLWRPRPPMVETFAIEAASGRERCVGGFEEFSRMGDAPGTYHIWYDTRTAAVVTSSGVVFVDVESGTRRFCAGNVATYAMALTPPIMPARPQDVPQDLVGLWLPGDTAQYGHPLLLRFRPEQPEASQLVVWLGTKYPMHAIFAVRCISPDGRRAIINTVQPGRHAVPDWTPWLCDLRTGKSEGIPIARLGKPLRDVAFAPDGASLVLSAGRELALWHMERRQFKVLASAPEGASDAQHWAWPSPSGRYLLKQSPWEPPLEVFDLAEDGRKLPFNPPAGMTTVVWMDDDRLLAQGLGAACVVDRAGRELMKVALP